MSVSAKGKQQKEVRQLVSGTVYWSYLILPFGIVACTFFRTIFLEIAVYKNYKIWRGRSTIRYKIYPNLRKRLKKVEKLRRLKSRPIFSECFELFDFPTGISGFLYVNGKCPLLASLSPRASPWRLLSRFLSRYPPNGELYCRLNEGDIGRYPIPQYRKKIWQIPKYRVENRLNTDTAYFNHIYNRFPILMVAAM